MNQPPASPILGKIAYYQNRRDEIPNQELAKELASTRNSAGIAEIAANLWSKNSNIASDCLKVLYEIGYLAPQLIADYTGEFLKRLKHKNNRMVWGAMIGLGTVASLRPAEIGAQIDTVLAAFEKGSLITIVWGVKVLAAVAASDPAYRSRLFPVLIQTLKTCIPRDLPLHAENSLPAVDEHNQAEFLALLEARRPELSTSQLTRLKKVLRKLT